MYNINHISLGTNPNWVTIYIHRPRRGESDPNPARNYSANFNRNKDRAARRVIRMYAIFNALMKQQCGG